MARFLAAGICAALVLAFTLSVPAQAQAQKPPPDYAVWPHEGSDLKPDPRIRYGQLPNGMRYAIQKTNRPEGHAAIRLRISAGSLHETDQEQGLAHYLEHMAFQGSKNLTRNEFVQKLQRLGLSFGADTNASTGFTETVYMLNLPRADATTFGESMNIMREVADRLTISQESVDSERGVILSEDRVRDTPALRAAKRLYADLYEGMKLPNRFPIGTVETIKGANAKLLRGFYERYYRPERALLVVTGSIDVDAVEKQITGLFSDWRQPGKMGPEPERGTAKIKPLRAINFVDPSFPGTISVNWVTPEPWQPAGRADSISDMRRWMAQQIVNARMQRMAEKPDAPFASASIGCFASEQGDGVFARNCSLTVRAGAKGLMPSFAAAEQALRQSVNFAPDAGEIDRLVRLWRGILENDAAAADTADTTSTADQIADAIDSRTVRTHPKDYLALWEENGPKFTAQDYYQELQALYAGTPSLIFAQTPTALEGGEAALIAAFETSQKVAVAAAPPFVQQAFPYTDFGKPGKIAAKTEAADLGVTQVTFANGARLNIRPSDEEKDLVRMSLRVEGGIVSYPKGKRSFGSAISTLVLQGGLGKMTADDLDGALSGELQGWGWSTQVTDFAIGATLKSSAALKGMQTLTAYVSDPAFRTEALEQARTNYLRGLKGRYANAQSVYSWAAPAILADGDPRFDNMTEDEAKAATLASVKALIAPALAKSAIEFTVVGDITVEDAIAFGAQTLGALPKRRAMRTGLLPAPERRFPAAAKTIELTHEGRADQVLLALAWPTGDLISNPRKARAGAMAQALINTALGLALRDKGFTYSIGGGHSPSDTVKDNGTVTLTVDTKPENLDAVRTMVLEQVQKIAAGDFTDDLLLRAREPQVSRREADLKSNEYWLSTLSRSQAMPMTLEITRSRLPDFKSVTREEITAAAKDVYLDPRRIEIRIVPKPKS
jgi:zinc protease